VKTIIIGLGNPVLGDDGAGWQIVDAVNEKLGLEGLSKANAEIIQLSLGGLSLMEHLVGFEHAILVDAIRLQRGPVGTVYHFSLDELDDPMTGHTSSAHDTTLQSAISMGRQLGLQLPEHVEIVAVEAEMDYTFSESLTPAVASAVPIAAQMVIDLLAEMGTA